MKKQERVGPFEITQKLYNKILRGYPSLKEEEADVIEFCLYDIRGVLESITREKLTSLPPILRKEFKHILDQLEYLESKYAAALKQKQDEDLEEK